MAAVRLFPSASTPSSSSDLDALTLEKLVQLVMENEAIAHQVISSESLRKKIFKKYSQSQANSYYDSKLPHFTNNHLIESQAYSGTNLFNLCNRWPTIKNAVQKNAELKECLSPTFLEQLFPTTTACYSGSKRMRGEESKESASSYKRGSRS